MLETHPESIRSIKRLSVQIAEIPGITNSSPSQELGLLKREYFYSVSVTCIKLYVLLFHLWRSIGVQSHAFQLSSFDGVGADGVSNTISGVGSVKAVRQQQIPFQSIVLHGVSNRFLGGRSLNNLRLYCYYSRRVAS